MREPNRQVVIANLEWHAADKLASTRPQKSFHEAFTTVDATSMMLPASAHRSAIYFAWLQWQVDADFDRISQVLTADVQRAVDAIASDTIPVGIDERDFHDRMMMIAGILSGNRSAMHKAAEQVQLANPRTTKYQYESAFAGILASRILGDQKEEHVQRGVMQKYQPTRVDPWPSGELVNSFVKRDYAALAIAVKEGAEKHWSNKYLGRGSSKPRLGSVVVEEQRNSMLIDLWKKDANFWWPYVEAAFAKLAILDGAKIAYDSFWLPSELLHAMKG